MYTKRNQGEKRKKIKFLSPTLFLVVSLVNDTFPTGLAHTHWGMCVCSFTRRQDIGRMPFEALHLDDTRQDMNHDGKTIPPLQTLACYLEWIPGLQEEVLPTIGTKMKQKSARNASSTLPPYSGLYTVLWISRQTSSLINPSQQNGALLTSSWTSRSQPAFSKIWTTERWPLLAAR